METYPIMSVTDSDLLPSLSPALQRPVLESACVHRRAPPPAATSRVACV